MSIALDFDYQKPSSVDEVVSLLVAHGPAARVLAGGTDLVGWMRDDLVAPDVVIDLKGVPGLNEVRTEGGVLRVGTLVTFTDVLESSEIADTVPLLVEMASTVASVGIRNRATVLGNICSAVPCCDAGPVLQALDASIEVAGPDGERSVDADGWFLGPRQTCLSEGEVALGLSIPIPSGRWGGAYVKLTRYGGEDLAQASVAVTATDTYGYRVSFGAVAPTPVRARRIEALLAGREPTDDLMAAAVDLVSEEIAPITDVRATKEYRLLMSGVMLRRGVHAAVARARGEGPPYGTRLV